MDMNLALITDTYALFAQYKIFIPQDDYDKVDSLQLSFNRMLDNVSFRRDTIFKTVIIIINSIGQKSFPTDF